MSVNLDVVLWKGGGTGIPRKVWDALESRTPVPFVLPLTFAAIRDAFVAEFGHDANVVDELHSIHGDGWELTVEDGDKYVYVECAWDEYSHEWNQIRSAAKRAGCHLYCVESGRMFPTEVLAAPPESNPRPIEEGLHTGDAVTHPKFGAGRVLAVDGVGDTAKVRVTFADAERQLQARFLTKTSATVDP